MNTVNVLLVGVGGQGTVLASRILGEAAIQKGLDVKVSEVHGMSQRGGSVVTYVRYGDQVHAPIFSEGDADYIVAFEALEALRFLPMLKHGGIILQNTGEIPPTSVNFSGGAYPQQVDRLLREKGVKVYPIDANALADSLGMRRAVNAVLLGAFGVVADFSKEELAAALESVLGERFLEINKEAIALGFDSMVTK